MIFRDRQTRLTQPGWIFVGLLGLILVSGAMKDFNLMLALGGMMIGAIYFNWWAVRSMLRRLTVSRRLPAAAVAGDTVVVELEAASPHRATAVVVEDMIRRGGAGRNGETVRAVAVFPQVPPGQPARSEYRVRFSRRGSYEFGPVQLTTRHPFGLVSRMVRMRAQDKMIVLPRLGRLTRRWLELRHGADPAGRQAARRQGLTEGDFYGLRDWRHGDSRRWIHWRTSARRGSLMVRQFEQPRTEHLILLVDLWQPARPDPRQEENVERAVSFAATIAAEVCRRGGCQLLVATAGAELVWAGGGASRALAREVFEQLALAESAPHDRLRELIACGLDSGPTGGRIVLVSTRPDSPETDWRQTAAAAAPQRVAAINRMLRIDAGSEKLREYFELE